MSNNPEGEMDKLHGSMLPKVKVGSDKLHHMTSKKIGRQVNPDPITVEPDDSYLYKKPNTEIPIAPPPTGEQ
jgi:hypothetical protein